MDSHQGQSVSSSILVSNIKYKPFRNLRHCCFNSEKQRLFQIIIYLNRKSNSGLLKSVKILEKIDNIEVVELGSKDIVRDEMVTKIINAYDSYDDQIKDLFDKSS